MPKQKTHKGLTKRVKVTAKGKIKRGVAGSGHLMSCKNAKRRRRLSKTTLVDGTNVKVIRAKLGV
ncbi:MAG: 50S ribosomal protein L35 [Planctomycetota bacterium]|jgi:large subunit ribosomal protein L35